MTRIRSLFVGGIRGNEQLTAVVAALLLVLLFVEGMTLLRLDSLLTVHAFIGVMLIPIVALKLGSTGWRMLRYYVGAAEYVDRGPPARVLRALVAPTLILSTVVLFGTGVAMLALGTDGTIVTLHKASFLVWFSATGVHVLAHVWRLPRLLTQVTPGRGIRLILVTGAVVSGLTLATVVFPSVDHIEDAVSAHFGLDSD